MTTPTVAIRVLRAPRVPRSSAWFLASAVVLALFTLAAVFAPLLAPYDPDQVDLLNIQAGPSTLHWLGTDRRPRHALADACTGRAPRCWPRCSSSSSSTVLGVPLGLVAGWRRRVARRRAGTHLRRRLRLPALLIAIMAVALFGKGLVAPVIAMSIAYAPFVARRHPVARHRRAHPPYVAAYRVQGFSGAWIASRRVLPNVTPIIGAQSTLNFGYVLAELAPCRSSDWECRPRPPTGAR